MVNLAGKIKEFPFFLGQAFVFMFYALHLLMHWSDLHVNGYNSSGILIFLLLAWPWYQFKGGKYFFFFLETYTFCRSISIKMGCIYI